MEAADDNSPKRRSQADKIGKHKYELELLHRIEGRLERIEWSQRTIFHGLQGYFHFERPLVEKVACESELDLAVITCIYEAGLNGILAKEISAKLAKYNLEHHKILRIMNRVNRNVETAFGKLMVQKLGKKWALTDFGFELWGKIGENQEETLESDES